jgi:hypothetical protein
MGCEKIRELILEYSEGNLNQSDKLEVESHLRECKGCNLYFGQSDKVWNLLDKWDTLDTKDDFIPRFWDRVSEEDTKGGGVFDFFRNLRVDLVAGVVGVIMLILTVFLVNIFVSHNENIVFTEEDRADEELLIEFDKAITKETPDSLEVYGLWDVREPQSNDENSEENNGG